MKNIGGFTLIELVVTIAIAAVVLAFAVMFLQAPADAYMASARQSELQDSISIAWPRMQSDIQLALPNSARERVNGSIKVLELLPIVDSARFLSAPGGSFRTAGYLSRTPAGYYIAIDNDPLNGRDAYDPASKLMTTDANAISLVGTAADRIIGEDSIQITPAFTFSAGPLSHRIYLLQKPVTYLCNENAHTLQRFSGYSVAALQSARDTAAELLSAGATGSVLAQNVTFCKFVVVPPAVPGTASQIVTVQMTATRDSVTTSLYETAAVRPLQ